ncbi:unnamed protein product [Ostreobium quekettii]|uniref:Uncharacterized protein n=1 Tax=Ostreobium quekettii TaxID=121088 RepID=A0A8S1JGC1_9CHLO|nr:unnamed protein product [Ostreobium quekettii]
MATHLCRPLVGEAPAAHTRPHGPFQPCLGIPFLHPRWHRAMWRHGTCRVPVRPRSEAASRGPPQPVDADGRADAAGVLHAAESLCVATALAMNLLAAMLQHRRMKSIREGDSGELSGAAQRSQPWRVTAVSDGQGWAWPAWERVMVWQSFPLILAILFGTALRRLRGGRGGDEGQEAMRASLGARLGSRLDALERSAPETSTAIRRLSDEVARLRVKVRLVSRDLKPVVQSMASKGADGAQMAGQLGAQLEAAEGRVGDLEGVVVGMQELGIKQFRVLVQAIRGVEAQCAELREGLRDGGAIPEGGPTLGDEWGLSGKLGQQGWLKEVESADGEAGPVREAKGYKERGTTGGIIPDDGPSPLGGPERPKSAEHGNYGDHQVAPAGEIEGNKHGETGEESLAGNVTAGSGGFSIAGGQDDEDLVIADSVVAGVVQAAQTLVQCLNLSGPELLNGVRDALEMGKFSTETQMDSETAEAGSSEDEVLLRATEAVQRAKLLVESVVVAPSGVPMAETELQGSEDAVLVSSDRPACPAF